MVEMRKGVWLKMNLSVAIDPMERVTYRVERKGERNGMGVGGQLIIGAGA